MPPTLLTKEICRNYIEEHLFSTVISSQNKLNNEVGFIGVELESFPYSVLSDKRIQPIKLYGGEDSLMDTLIRVSKQNGGVVKLPDENADDKFHQTPVPAIEFPGCGSFHFEPGAQVEISTAPCGCLEKLDARLKFLQNILSIITEQKKNIHFAQFGTNPWFTVDEIGMQMNKTRYRAMSRYFDNINPYGRQMMLQTSSLQVNIDLGTDETILAKRIIAANLLAPFVTAIFANSSFTAGKANGYKSYRSFIWQHLDKTRTGVLPIDQLSKKFDKDELIDTYLGFALHAPIIYIEDFGDEIFPATFTLEYWMNHPIKGLLPTLAHFKNHLTLLFPEVRLKGYLELRSVDAPPPEWQMIPVLFYAGLLYSNQFLDKTIDLLLPFAPQLISLMEKATCGLDSDDVFNISKALIALAIEGLSMLPDFFKSKNDIAHFISFSEKYTLRRKTFADVFPEAFYQDKIFLS